jgi:polar amino acid transport system substrate-binding protein
MKIAGSDTVFHFVFLTLFYIQIFTAASVPQQWFNPSFFVIVLDIFSLALLLVGIFALFLSGASRSTRAANITILDANKRDAKNAKVAIGISPMARLFRGRRSSLLSLFFVGLAAVTLFVTWLSVPMSSSPGLSVPTPRSTFVPIVNDLVIPGQLTVGSYLSLPPQSFADSQQKPIGFDIDLISAIAQKMQLKVKVVSIDYGNLITSLKNKHVDVVISAYPVSNALGDSVTAIPYLNPSEALLLRKGNPQKINLASLNDLCGISISVLAGSLENTMLQDATKRCKSGAGINLVKEQNTKVVVDDVVNGVTQAAFQDSPTSSYYLSIPDYQDKIELSAKQLAGKPEGILLRNEHYALFNAVQFAFNLVVQDQTYQRLLKQWSMESDALAPSF